MVEVELRTVVAGVFHLAVAVSQPVNGDDPAALRLYQRPFIVPDVAARNNKGGPAAFIHGFVPGVFIHRRSPDRSRIGARQNGGLAGWIHRAGNGTVIQVAGDIGADGVSIRNADVHDERIGLGTEVSGYDHAIGIVPAGACDAAAGGAGGGGDLRRITQRHRRGGERGQNLLYHRAFGRSRYGQRNAERQYEGKNRDQRKQMQFLCLHNFPLRKARRPRKQPAGSDN